MATLSDAKTAGDRTYAALIRRNRLVGILRIGVPIFGLIVFAGLIVQIILANLAFPLSVSNVRLERGALVVEAPQYSGRMANGTVYVVRARVAESSLTGADEIALADSDITLTRPDGYRLRLQTGEALFSIAGETMRAKDLMIVTDSRGINADLYDSVVDLGAQRLDVTGAARIRFADGSVLDAEELIYDAVAQTWAFKGTRLVVPQSEIE